MAKDSTEHGRKIFSLMTGLILANAGAGFALYLNDSQYFAALDPVYLESLRLRHNLLPIVLTIYNLLILSLAFFRIRQNAMRGRNDYIVIGFTAVLFLGWALWAWAHNHPPMPKARAALEARAVEIQTRLPMALSDMIEQTEYRVAGNSVTERFHIMADAAIGQRRQMMALEHLSADDLRTTCSVLKGLFPAGIRRYVLEYVYLNEEIIVQITAQDCVGRQ